MTRPLVIDFPYQDAARLFAPHADKVNAAFLDSSQIDKDQGRYSYIALDPIKTFENSETIFNDLESCLLDHPFENLPDLPPFQGGLLGYFSYELLHQLEKVPEQREDYFTVPNVHLGFYDVICAFDHLQEKSWIISLFGENRALWLQDQLINPIHLPKQSPVQTNWKSRFTKADYCAAVQRVIDYITAGDIFQANLTQRFETDLPSNFSKYVFYLNLRKHNPALFAGYLNFEGFTIASSSPERFLKSSDRQIETRPIKGTRPRKTNALEDNAQKEELINSEKDRAENTMIVDLLRNDLSKVCEPHSIKVTELNALYSFAAVHHLISCIKGTLEKGKNAIDLLKATFPGGSITGAPKVRAMEIISELERNPRGPYCGAIGFIGCNGELDTNIVIRTVLFKDNKACVQVGGGIVYGSDPETEYQETLDKAQALFDAFEKASS